ncbi:MAG: STAS/SEC14 domain-containing protein [Bacteroidia bacterium]|nr:STAS/SEC14 domain-containing protein [Bacteroidia bacterium]
MMYSLIDLPKNMIGFKAQWQITERDCNEVLQPAVENHLQKAENINCVLVLNNFNEHLKNSALKSLKYFIKWRSKVKRIAIVAESEALKKIIGVLNTLMPAELKGFSSDELKMAIDWAGNEVEHEATVFDSGLNV